MNQKVTIKDIAKKLNVTPSTISRALSDHPSISTKTKDLVRKTAIELNYHPNRMASSLRRGKGHSIGVVLPKINSNFMSNCIFGIESVTYPSGYDLIICQSNESFEKEMNNIEALIASRVSGVLISLSRDTKNIDHLRNVLRRNVPLVMFDRIEESLNVDSAVNDDRTTSADAVVHLAKQGFKKIAILSGPTHTYVYKNRLMGYLDGLRLSNLEINENWIYSNVFSKDNAKKIVKDIFKKSLNKSRPDAFFCTGDKIALGVLQSVKELGLSIPDDIGVIGYANDPFSSIITPSLTTIEQFPKEIGISAAKIIINLIEQGKTFTSPNKKILIKPQLIVRETSSRVTNLDASLKSSPS